MQQPPIDPWQGWQAQPPNTSYPSNPQWPPSQPLQPLPPPQYTQYPPLHQQPPQPSKKSHRRLWIILSIIGGVLVLSSATCGIVAAFSPAPQPTVQSPTPTFTSQAVIATATPTSGLNYSQGSPVPTITDSPTPIPPTPTQPVPAVTHGTPLLGGPISDFIGKYGQPNANSQPSQGGYDFALYGTPTVSDLSITTEGPRALNILLNSPTNQGWTEEQAIAACLAFAPSDSVYKRSMTLLDGQGNPMALQRVYYSSSLARQFKASDFTDENSNQTTPGTFGMVLTYDSSNTAHILSCTAQVGLQSK